MPAVNQLASEIPELRVLGLSVAADADSPSIATFKSELAATYTIFDADPTDLAELYGVTSIPTFYLVDRNQNVAWSHVGDLSSTQAREIETVVAAMAAPEPVAAVPSPPTAPAKGTASAPESPQTPAKSDVVDVTPAESEATKPPPEPAPESPRVRKKKRKNRKKRRRKAF